MIVRKIEKKQIKRKVAAYARVSTLNENQEESFASQVRYFTEYIQSVPHWEFVEVYADEGFSGVSAEHRPGFMRMINDAKAGKIDLILVKSISRFARNSLEAQTYMHMLKDLQVEIRFERESISSFDPQAEMVFNFLVIMAQEESKSISQNTKWSLEYLARQGIRRVGSNHVMGYAEIDGVLTPNEDAWIVKKIFTDYADGKSTREIAEELEELGVKSLRGKDVIGYTTISRMLRNEVYKGDRLLQKAPHSNVMTHKPEKGTAYNSYYVSDDHEPIVSKELWDKVQKLLDQPMQGKTIRNKNSHYLRGKIICGECGSPFVRITSKNRKEKFKSWICTDRRAGKKGNGCKCPIIREEKLLDLIDEDEAYIEKIVIWKDGRYEVEAA